MTDLSAHAAAVEALPHDPPGIVEAVRRLLIHEHMGALYGVSLPPAHMHTVHDRPVAAMLDWIANDDPRNLLTARTPAQRYVCCCRHYTVLTVALLRAKGFAARARCGFAAYFEPSLFVDHWVCEVYDPARQRWYLLDAQLDEVQRRHFAIRFDPFDVPRDQFIVGGEAWQRCRTGIADPADFGVLDMHGLWFVGGNVIRDATALNNVELLPWDVWGAMFGPDTAPQEALLKWYDELAALTIAPDASLDELRRYFADDPRLRVPAEVRNDILGRMEPV
ncbi:MAG: transglutaminase domain-containing protein [Alphaproteobacteria bacterium]